jgi:hypothetical protein
MILLIEFIRLFLLETIRLIVFAPGRRAGGGPPRWCWGAGRPRTATPTAAASPRRHRRNPPRARAGTRAATRKRRPHGKEGRNISGECDGGADWAVGQPVIQTRRDHRFAAWAIRPMASIVSSDDHQLTKADISLGPIGCLISVQRLIIGMRALILRTQAAIPETNPHTVEGIS